RKSHENDNSHPRWLIPDVKMFGAEEGTRTPTPLRVHGPEPCASANSATSASDLLLCGGCNRLDGRDCDIYSTRRVVAVKPPQTIHSRVSVYDEAEEARSSCCSKEQAHQTR